LGQLSELIFNIEKSEKACEVIKEGRLIAWYRLRDQGIEIDQQNINSIPGI
jgi:sporulation protein YlmC with PRC-barrel domain